MFIKILKICGFTVCLFSLPLFAQEVSDPDKDQLYVTDQLRLSLYQRPDSQSQVVKLLSSGDKLQVQELSGAYAFVTAPGGSKGWVKRGFLVPKPTSNLLLIEEQKKSEGLQGEIDKLANSKVVIDQYEKDLDTMVEKMEEADSKNLDSEEVIASLRTELEKQKQKMEMMKENSEPAITVLWETATQYWKIIIPIILGIMLFSFVISKAIVETRIKKKFHGIKIW